MIRTSSVSTSVTDTATSNEPFLAKGVFLRVTVELTTDPPSDFIAGSPVLMTGLFAKEVTPTAVFVPAS